MEVSKTVSCVICMGNIAEEFPGAGNRSPPPVDIYFTHCAGIIRRRRRRRHRYWVHPLHLMRNIWGEEHKVREMYNKYPVKFFQYTRMTPERFEKLLGFVRCDIEKQDTNYRIAIPVDIRLFICLRYFSAPRGICKFIYKLFSCLQTSCHRR